MIVKANGIKMNYELSGRKNAPVVMLSHSLGSSIVMWDPQMASLEPSFQVLRYDIRGHGASEVTGGFYTLEMLAEDAIGLLDAFSIDNVHFVGLSMGGMIGQCLALNYAARIQSLSLCDTSAMTPKEGQPVIQERIDTAREKGMKALVEPTLERWFTPAFLQQSSPGLAFIRNQILATPVTGYIGCSKAIQKLNYLDRLTQIKIPTLIMVGEDDPGTPVAASQAIHERIQNSRLVIIPSARHLSNVEQPEIFNAALIKFLKEV